MRLVNMEYNIELNLSLNKTNVLCIENRRVFAGCITDLWNQCEAGEGRWQLSDHDSTLPIAKSMICIVNPINLDCNDKKLLKALYQDMDKDVQENMYLQLGNINSKMVSLIDEIVKRQPYAIEYDDSVSLMDILKIYNVCFVKEFDTILEGIVTYIQLWHRVGKISVFAFVNLKAYLCDSEIEQLYEMIRYEQVYIILFESHYEKKLLDENVKIIDNDLCIIDC